MSYADYGAQVGDWVRITGADYHGRVGSVVIRTEDGWGNTSGVGVVLNPTRFDSSRVVLWFKWDEYEVVTGEAP